MVGIFVYSLKCAIVLTLLYLVYLLVFRNNTAYVLKRVVLLAMISISVTLPLIQIELDWSLADQANTQAWEEQVTDQIPFDSKLGEAPGVIYIDLDAPPQPVWKFDAEAVVYGYWVGVLLAFLWFLGHLFYIVGLVLLGEKLKQQGLTIIRHRAVKGPFSFGKWLFLPIDQELSGRDWEIISSHEQIHLRQAHTLDLLLASVARCLMWFTPAVYLLQRSIQNNHEYLVDRNVVARYGFADYSAALVNASLNAKGQLYTHSFSLKSNLSQRIKNMKLKKTSQWKSGLALTALLCMTMLVFTQVSLQAQEDQWAKLNHVFTSFMNKDGERSGFDSYALYKKTGQQPDAWGGFHSRHTTFPIMLLDNHQAILEAFQRNAKTPILGLDDPLFRVIMSTERTISMDELVIGAPKVDSRTVLVQELSTQELIEMYALTKAWVEEHIWPDYPDFPLISELDFVKHKYLLYRSSPNPNNPMAFSVKKTYPYGQVDQKPEPIGGLERYLSNVTKYCTRDEALKDEDLPKKIEFGFVIDPGGMMVELSLKSKVKGDDDTQDRVYDLLKQINDNMIKVSDVYHWKPGIKDGKRVATEMSLEIPLASL